MNFTLGSYIILGFFSALFLTGHSTYPDILQDSVIPGNKYILLILSRLGLGNRLRSMADWYRAAVFSGRTLIVSWEATLDCGANFYDLFEINSAYKFHVLTHHLPSFDDGINFALRSVKLANLSALPIFSFNESKIWSNSRRGEFFLKRSIVENDYDIIITHYDGVLTLDRTPCQDYLSKHSKFLASLKPIPMIQSIVNSFKLKYFPNKIMIGIHYRAHDSKFDWEIVPPIHGNHAVSFDTSATIDSFSQVIKILSSHFEIPDHGKRTETHAGFFLTSSNLTIRSILQSIAPNILTIENGSYERSTKEGIQVALVEFLILSECDLIVNSYGSSFSLEASMINMRPLVSIWFGNLIFRNHILLPHCGHYLYASHDLENLPSNHIVENTHDKRTIQSFNLTLNNTQILSGFGLRDVYYLP